MFLALQQCLKACLKSSSFWIGWSQSYLSSMCWMISPCLSVLPICQWAYAATTRRWQSQLCMSWENCSEHRLEALSMISCLHGPAHWNHMSLMCSINILESVRNTGTANWKLVAESIMCRNWWILPSLPVHETKSQPTQSLNSRLSGRLAGREIRGWRVSWHVSHWKSPAPATTSAGYPWSRSTFWNFWIPGCPRLWWILDIHCRVAGGSARNLLPCCMTLEVGSTDCGTSLTSWVLGSGSVGKCAGVIASCMGSWRTCFRLLGSESWAGLLLSIRWLAKMVTNSRTGGLLLHSWRLLICSHSTQSDCSSGSRLYRWRPSDSLQDASLGISLIGGFRKRSVPLQSSITRMVCSGYARWTMSNKSPCSRICFPTLGAHSRALDKMSLLVITGTKTGEALELELPSGSAGYPGGAVTLKFKRRRFGSSSPSCGRLSDSLLKHHSCVLTSCTWMLAWMAFVILKANVRVYNSEYADTNLRLPSLSLYDPATLSCSWSLLHLSFSAYCARMAEVVNNWVPFFNSWWVTGCFSFPAWHMSHTARCVPATISWKQSWCNISEPAGCSRWKWKVGPAFSWCLNRATHSRRWISSWSLARWTFSAASRDLAALNWFHLHHALHLGEAHMCFGRYWYSHR